MKKTVKEIIDMINTGKLQYNQSTQRKFVYADMEVVLDDRGKTSKAGSLIHSILEENIQLPALYFWHNTETGATNIHDGKQRVLSLYYFIQPQGAITIDTYRNGKQVSNFNALSQADQDRLMNYTFDIVERSGTSEEEERSFYLINTNPVPLTDYESLSGMLHGNFLTSFENYIDSLHLDKVKPVGRGEQAYKFLLAMFNIANTKKAAFADCAIKKLANEIRKVRDIYFNPVVYRLDEILNLFNSLMRFKLKLKEDRALAIATYVVTNGLRSLEIKQLYERCENQRNDMNTWDLATHYTFINYFATNGYQSNVTLDPKRNFSADDKDTLYQKGAKCAHPGCTVTAYKELEVDHITPWSKGGRTIIGNAQLLCKHHNTSKGNRP